MAEVSSVNFAILGDIDDMMDWMGKEVEIQPPITIKLPDGNIQITKVGLGNEEDNWNIPYYMTPNGKFEGNLGEADTDSLMALYNYLDTSLQKTIAEVSEEIPRL